ncbi:hypothetical protein QUW15_03050 [Desulfovibrio piger]|nr:hypothetical protein [Desulfovibrio piger]
MMLSMPYADSALPMPMPDALEVVDGRNRPLLVMPCADVLRQRLLHRAVALLPHLRQHFFLMRRRSVWDVAGIVPLPAGESCALTAQQLLEQSGLPPCPLSRIALLPPDADFPCFVELFAARLHAEPRFPEAWEALSVDADALTGLQALPDAPLSPLLRRIKPQWLRDYGMAARSAPRRSSSQAAACTRPLLATTSSPKR